MLSAITKVCVGSLDKTATSSREESYACIQVCVSTALPNNQKAALSHIIPLAVRTSYVFPYQKEQQSNVYTHLYTQ